MNVNSMLVALILATVLGLSAPSLAAGPELSRRGFLIGAGATIVAVKVPKIIQTPSPRGFIFIDEFQNANADDLRFLERLVADGKVSDVRFLGSDSFVRNSWQPMRIQNQLTGKSMDAFLRAVGRETMKIIENMTEQIIAPSREEVLKVINQIEARETVECELELDNSKDLLVVERD